MKEIKLDKELKKQLEESEEQTHRIWEECLKKSKGDLKKARICYKSVSNTS